MTTDRDREILAINQRMLESVVAGDWQAYSQTCDSSLSCFEAETNGVLAEGLNFHRYYFTLAGEAHHHPSPVNVTMARPHLRWLSDDCVVLSYTRLTQRKLAGEPVTASCCETRIWQRQEGEWRQVHVHRS